MIKPFFCLYGGKFRAAKHYDVPLYDTIIEPFAGGAGYSLRYYDRKIILIEKDPDISELWKYLIKATEKEILNIPNLTDSGIVDDVNTHAEGKLLISWWVNAASSRPCKRLSKSGRDSERSDTEKYAVYWGPKIRQRIASQVDKIKHWKIIQDDYFAAPDIKATWFIDPPYQIAGKHYKYNSKKIDYQHLSQWCKDRKGQVMVCENAGANWLPFKEWRNIKASPFAKSGKISKEAIWSHNE